MLHPIWLNTFKTLIEVGHFTKTAEILHMTQPGVSQHIKKLEEVCGYPLILRFNKKFELTIQGKKVYQYALSRIDEESKLLQDLGNDEPCAGQCTIGCSGTLAWLLYSKLLTMQSEYPALSFKFEAAPNHLIFEHIRKDTIDIGLVAQKPNPKYFESQQISTESLVFAVPQNITDNHSLITLLNELGVIQHPDLEHYFQTYISQTKHHTLANLSLSSIPVKSYINQIHQILEPVSKGIGFTVIPHHCISLFVNNEKVKILDLNETIEEPIYLVYKRHTSLARRYEKVLDRMKDILNYQGY